MTESLASFVTPLWPNGVALIAIILGIYVFSRRGLIQALKNSEDQYRDTVENAVEGIIRTSREGRWVFLNSAFARMLGYDSKEELLTYATSIETQIYVDAEVRRDFLRRLERDKRATCEYEAWKKDGTTTWLFVSSRVVEDRQGRFQYYESIAEDISERRKRESELRRTAEALAQSNAELQRFAHTIAHDLTEPLRTVRLYLDLIAAEKAGQFDESTTQYMKFVSEASSRMNSFILDILDFSRFGTTKVNLQATKVDKIVTDVVHNLEIAIKEAKAEIKIGPLPEIAADPTKLMRLFQNLLNNALKFRSERPTKIEITAESQGHQWIFAIKDNGLGFDERHKEKMFRLFVRLQDRSKYPGSGMGLAMCKAIVELHGGRIWAESKVGEGSVFYFSIPIAETSELQKAAGLQ